MYSPITFQITHKKFRDVQFQKGYFYYVGSAQKNLPARIRRHNSKSKTIFWHIDHITSQKFTKLKNVVIFIRAKKKYESLISRKFTDLKLAAPVLGFGSSDDKLSKAHLFYSKMKIDYNHFSDLYHEIVCLSPSSVDITG